MRQGALLSLTVILVAGGLAACAEPATDQSAAATPEARTTAADDPSEAREFSEMWDSVMKHGDADAMAAMFTEDAVRLAMDQPLVTGRDAIRQEFVTMFDGATWEPSNPVDEIVVTGDWGWARGTFDDVRTDAESGETSRVTGKWMTILSKTADGWKYALDAGNENAPGATGPSPEAVDLPPSEGKTSGDPADVEAIRQLINVWEGATENADQRDSFVQSFATDGVRMNDDAPTDIGHDAIRERWIGGFVEGAEEDAELTLDVIEVVGDWAWVRGHWGTTNTPPEGSVVRFVGKYANVLERTADGWKIKVSIWNYDSPPAPLPEA